MTIQRIDDNSFRCVLSPKDLAERDIILSELTYGKEKANTLFSEIVDKASDEYGYDFEGKPLMV